MERIEPANQGLKVFLAAISGLVLAITLSAGLWPFSFHLNNQVQWNTGQAGLWFGNHGMVISKGEFSGMPSDAAKGCSLELLLEPAQSSEAGTILSFYRPGNSSRIELRQSLDDLAFTRVPGPAYNRKNQRSVFVDHVLQQNKALLITLASLDGVFNVYLNGVLRKSTRNVEVQGADFAGTLLLANTPYGNSSWSGIVRGLATYDRALQPDDVRQSYEKWTGDRARRAIDAPQPYSLFLFNEQSGRVLHNLGKAGPDLEIPENYFVLHPGFLVPFWREFHLNGEYLEDITINVLGLVPLGFCFAAIFAWRKGRRHSLLYVTLLGLCVSLTIEILQAFMPTRNSGTTDLFTNTAGSAFGGYLYLNSYAQNWLKRLRLLRADCGKNS